MCSGDEGLLRNLSDVTSKPLEWAWEGMIPFGKLTLLTGEPGVGKSLVALQVAAMVTRGLVRPPGISPTVGASRAGGAGDGPGGMEGASLDTGARARAVVVLSAEDAADDTVLPRMTAAGADISKVFVMQEHWGRDRTSIGVGTGEAAAAKEAGDSLFRLSRDLPRLELALERIHEAGLEIGLIVIDPIDRYFGPNDKKRDRIEVVARLVELAARTGAAVLVISNSSYKTGNRGATAVSQELIHSARSVLMVA